MGKKKKRQFSAYLSWQYHLPEKPRIETQRFYNFINWKFLLPKKKKKIRNYLVSKRHVWNMPRVTQLKGVQLQFTVSRVCSATI